MSGYHIDWMNNKKCELTAQSGSNEKLEHDTIVSTTTFPDTTVIAEVESENVQLSAQAQTPEKKEEKIGKENYSLNERMARNVKLSWIPRPWLAKKSGSRLETLQDYNKAGVGFGMVAFAFSVLCFIALIMALAVTGGWSALGWFAISVILGAITLLFTIIAQIIFWRNHEGIPAFMVLPLIISAFAIYVIIRLIIDRIMRT